MTIDDDGYVWKNDNCKSRIKLASQISVAVVKDITWILLISLQCEPATSAILN